MSDVSYSGRTSVQGEGGRFQAGGGSISMGDGLNIPITVTFYTDTGGGEQAKQEIHNIGNAAEETGKKTSGMGKSLKESDKELRDTIAPVRSLSWDFMLMGRGLSVMNNYLFGGNQAFKEFIGVVYTFGAVLRVATTAVDIYRIAHKFLSAVAVQDEAMHGTMVPTLLAEASAHGTLATAIGIETTAVWGEVAAYTALAVVTGGGSIAGGAAAGVAGGVTKGLTAGIGGSMGGVMGKVLGTRQSGGFIPQTGLYLMHQGETVIPKGGPTMTMININMQTGGISSNIDIDNLLNAMASKMALESRRRSGR
jgi:hypothetical protein